MTEKNIMQKPLLTIAIPTFNRAAKLRRLLAVLQEEIATPALCEQVAVLVSDNASSDETPFVVSEFAKAGFSLAAYRQTKNLGFDGNLRFLYTHATTEYVWYMADDDVPLKGAVANVVTALASHDPDVLLFSFIQPPGSTVRQFDYPEPVRMVTDTVSAIEHVLRYTKVSIFVLRKMEFDDSQWRTLDENLGDGWYYISLAFSVLGASRNLRLAAISEPLATCDEDYYVIAYVPEPLLRMERMVRHPFVASMCPNLQRQFVEEGYRNAIQFAFAAKAGSLVPENMKAYDSFIRDLEWRMPVLLKAPRALGQFITLKMGITWMWPKTKGVLSVGRRLSKSPTRLLKAVFQR